VCDAVPAAACCSAAKLVRPSGITIATSPSIIASWSSACWRLRRWKGRRASSPCRCG
jgi:hypothetical protein